MKHPFLVAAIWMLATVLFSVQVQAANALSESEATKFLHDSGLDTLIASFPQTMQQQLNLKRLMESNQIKADRMEQALNQASQKINSQSIAVDYLTKKADAGALKNALSFLSSPLGQRIVVEERAASTAEAQLEMQAYVAELAQNPPSPERIQLIQKLAEALNSDQVIMSLMKGTFYSLLSVTESLNPDLAQTMKAMLDAEWSKMEPMMEQQFGQFVMMGAHYSYRNLPDADVKQYIEFLNTPSGQAYWKTGIQIIETYLHAFAKELVIAINESK